MINYKSLLLLLVFVVLSASCQTMQHSGQHMYLRRQVARIAVLPSENEAMEHPDAPIIFNKASESSLQRKGFTVIPADSAVTYAAANEKAISELWHINSMELGRDLGADFLFYSRLSRWEHSYSLVENKIKVSGYCWIVEVSTGALIWRHSWNHESQTSPDPKSDEFQKLLNIVVSALIDSATDRLADMGKRAAYQSIQTVPNPGSPR